MTAYRELIFVRIDTILAAVDGVAEYERMPSSDPVSFPALHTFDSGQQPVDRMPGATDYDMAFSVEGFFEQIGGKATHTALNNLYAKVVAALMADAILATLIETIDEGAMRVGTAPLASEPRMYFSLDFGVTFPTSRNDPAVPA